MGVASVGVNAGAGEGNLTHVNARPPADRWPYEKVISKRDMLISVLSYVSVDGCAV